LSGRPGSRVYRAPRPQVRRVRRPRPAAGASPGSPRARRFARFAPPAGSPGSPPPTNKPQPYKHMRPPYKCRPSLGAVQVSAESSPVAVQVSAESRRCTSVGRVPSPYKCRPSPVAAVSAESRRRSVGRSVSRVPSPQCRPSPVAVLTPTLTLKKKVCACFAQAPLVFKRNYNRKKKNFSPRVSEHRS
jgi:hypothetical protein